MLKNLLVVISLLFGVNSCSFVLGPWEKQLSRLETENNRIFESNVVFQTQWKNPKLKINLFIDEEYIEWPQELELNPLESNEFDILIKVFKIDLYDNVIDKIKLNKKWIFNRPIFYINLFPECKQKVEIKISFSKEVPSNVHFTMSVWDERSKM